MTIPEEGIRINKFLSEAGYCSRRAADALVTEGRVSIDGRSALMGERVFAGSTVCVDDLPVFGNDIRKIYAFYKPVGYISSLSDEQGEGISSFLTMTERVYPVGRLDKDSEGLMLLTNDGELTNRILTAANGHEKEYEVTVDKKLTDTFLRELEKGVTIMNRATGQKIVTAPCKTAYVDEHTFRITIIQGMNRQIRRMCGALAYKVVRLKRIRILKLWVGDLKPGEIREVSREELGLEDG